jgi:CheY-like chemotaxis protein
MSVQTENIPIEVLLVEDNPGDAELTSIALAESNLSVNLSVVSDGEAALTFLHRQHKYANAPYPDLVLLDLNLPKLSGHEVLAAVKVDEKLRRIPIVVLTTSISEEDILSAYDRHANCYIQKPVSFDRFSQVIQSIENFWFNVVKLPPR